jgi:AraC-like DNA-binding protein/mannose-6-phosphate isomerase-like protein (cupin superfamily)
MLTTHRIRGLGEMMSENSGLAHPTMGATRSRVISLDPTATPSPAKRYVYCPGDGATAIGSCIWRGDHGVPLGLHFHEEHQLTCVLSGYYRFVIGNRAVTVQAGECIFIPARHPHANVPCDQPGTAIVSSYIPVGRWQLGVGEIVVVPMCGNWREDRTMNLADLSTGVARSRFRVGLSDEPPQPEVLKLLAHGTKIVTIAETLGLTREGFIRQFSRQFGMSPHAYRLMRRLNDARTLLRRGDTIESVVSETGFVDASHLGRLFRRTFGTTPGVYRREMSAVRRVSQSLE